MGEEDGISLETSLGSSEDRTLGGMEGIPDNPTEGTWLESGDGSLLGLAEGLELDIYDGSRVGVSLGALERLILGKFDGPAVLAIYVGSTLERNVGGSLGLVE